MMDLKHISCILLQMLNKRIIVIPANRESGSGFLMFLRNLVNLKTEAHATSLNENKHNKLLTDSACAGPESFSLLHEP